MRNSEIAPRSPQMEQTDLPALNKEQLPRQECCGIVGQGEPGTLLGIIIGCISDFLVTTFYLFAEGDLGLEYKAILLQFVSVS